MYGVSDRWRRWTARSGVCMSTRDLRLVSYSSNRWLTSDESVVVGSFSAIYLSDCQVDVKVGPAFASMAGLLSRRLHKGKTERDNTLIRRE